MALLELARALGHLGLTPLDTQRLVIPNGQISLFKVTLTRFWRGFPALMVLTADATAEPFGLVIEQEGESCYRGLQWANGDRALLRAVLRVRVPRSFAHYMGDWWPTGNPPWAEFLAALMRVGEAHNTMKWMAPESVLSDRGLTQGWNASNAMLIVERTVALTSEYSDDVPHHWLVGTACVVSTVEARIEFGAVHTSRSYH